MTHEEFRQVYRAWQDAQEEFEAKYIACIGAQTINHDEFWATLDRIEVLRVRFVNAATDFVGWRPEPPAHLH